jgi:SAM-dependent methyltransferase
MADGFLERMESFRTRTRVRIKKWVLSAKTPGAWGQWFRLKAWRFVYDLLAYCYGGEILWTYMNYGYLPADGKLVTLDKDDNVSARVKNSDIYSIQLYHAVVSVVECEGKNLLEVGSGRGGGASYVSRYLKPKDVTGVELSSQAVQLANRIHKGVPNLHFVQGDACNLKNLPDNSYDVVFNVESSHCYPDFKKFLSEVHRVLTPGG